MPQNIPRHEKTRHYAKYPQPHTRRVVGHFFQSRLAKVNILFQSVIPMIFVFSGRAYQSAFRTRAEPMLS